MKLFQAFFILTTLVFLNLPTYSTEQAATSVDLKSFSTAVELPAPEPQHFTLSADSLQKKFERAVWNNNTQAQRTLLTQGIDINHINKQDGYA